MGKNHKAKTKNGKQKNGWLPAAAAVVLLAAVAASFFFRSGDGGGPSVSAKCQTVSAGGSLVIPVDEISSAARFYPVEVDGTQMEIIAVADSAGVIRTAFNTCQICYSSGRGYYVQDGNVLVCQNCLNRFTVDQVGIESGGCNPWPIFEADRTVTDGAVSISYDYLKAVTRIFSNWKTNS